MTCIGIEKGITGIFRMPYFGAKNEGSFGLIKGTFKGLIGVISKPISGSFDAVAKTAEGIKNTATYLDDKPIDMRQRLPRVFFGLELYYKQFSNSESEL